MFNRDTHIDYEIHGITNYYYCGFPGGLVQDEGKMILSMTCCQTTNRWND